MIFTVETDEAGKVMVLGFIFSDLKLKSTEVKWGSLGTFVVAAPSAKNGSNSDFVLQIRYQSLLNFRSYNFSNFQLLFFLQLTKQIYDYDHQVH